MSDVMKGELRVCPRDGEPIIYTFEFPGVERYCVVCGWTGDIFAGRTVPPTPGLVARHVELTDRYERERSERTGLPIPERREPQGEPPVCSGCGAVAQPPFDGDKPAHWYARTIDGVKQFACSRDCTDGPVMPW